MNGKRVVRILVLTSTYPRWPDDTLPPFVHELAHRLTGEFEVHVLAPHAAGCKTREQLDGVEVHRFRYLPTRLETLAYSSGMLQGLRRRPWRLLALPLFLMAEGFATLRLLRQRRFEVIHAHWLLPHGLIALLARALCGYAPAVVVTAHGADVYGLKGRFAVALKRRVTRLAEHVTVVSTAMLLDLTAECGEGAYSVLPMGVDTNTRFTPPPAGAQRRGLLFVGRLADKKGVSVLLNAMTRLRELTELKLSVIGAGPEEPALREQTARLELQRRVEFLGPVTNRELPDWYQRAALLVFPSVVATHGDQEGLGLVPVEALACECPVAASDLPAIRDVIRDGETGRLVAPGDPAALAAVIRELLLDPTQAQRLAAVGRAYVQARFDWDRVASRYSALFKSLAGGD